MTQRGPSGVDPFTPRFQERAGRTFVDFRSHPPLIKAERRM
ncbi:hypothetical protein ACSHWB_04085 [Lentzea sp. HUAS TT2]